MSTDVERLWRDIPARERFELLATIAEMREWRYGDVWPERLRPIREAALALHEWLGVSTTAKGTFHGKGPR